VTHYRRSCLALQILYIVPPFTVMSFKYGSNDWSRIWLKLAAVSITHILFVVGVLDQTFFQVSTLA
jgi:hypothetical protein